MDVQQLHYAPLLNQLHQRAVRSVVSQLALRSKSLTHYLESQYFQPPGQEGSLLADPVFESTFGWMPADETMEDLSSANIVTVVRRYLKFYVAPGVVQLICLPKRRCAVMERTGW